MIFLILNTQAGLQILILLYISTSDLVENLENKNHSKFNTRDNDQSSHEQHSTSDHSSLARINADDIKQSHYSHISADR